MFAILNQHMPVMIDNELSAPHRSEAGTRTERKCRIAARYSTHATAR